MSSQYLSNFHQIPHFAFVVAPLRVLHFELHIVVFSEFTYYIMIYKEDCVDSQASILRIPFPSFVTQKVAAMHLGEGEQLLCVIFAEHSQRWIRPQIHAYQLDKLKS